MCARFALAHGPREARLRPALKKRRFARQDYATRPLCRDLFSSKCESLRWHGFSVTDYQKPCSKARDSVAANYEILNEHLQKAILSANTHWLLAIALFLGIALGGCGGSTNSPTPPTGPPLNPGNVNLIFVVSEDLAYNAPGDINPSTANLTNRGLQRALQLAGFLRRQVLVKKNVTGIYALEPMTHLQTANNHPDIVSAETVQQFALLNHIALSSVLPPQYLPYTGNSYPLNASYASGSVPTGVATPTAYCANCRGLDFNDGADNNEALVTSIIAAGVPGFYVFSAPWETTSALLANINSIEDYNLTLPTSYQGPNYIYAISITPSGSVRLVTYNSRLRPGSKYPALPAPKPKIGTQCTGQAPFTINVTVAAVAPYFRRESTTTRPFT